MSQSTDWDGWQLRRVDKYIQGWRRIYKGEKKKVLKLVLCAVVKPSEALKLKCFILKTGFC